MILIESSINLYRVFHVTVKTSLPLDEFHCSPCLMKSKCSRSIIFAHFENGAHLRILLFVNFYVRTYIHSIVEYALLKLR